MLIAAAAQQNCLQNLLNLFDTKLIGHTSTIKFHSVYCSVAHVIVLEVISGVETARQVVKAHFLHNHKTTVVPKSCFPRTLGLGLFV